MIVWGGLSGGGGEREDGGRYDPVTDSWTPTSPSGVLSPRFGHSAVWTGQRMIVWGGYRLDGEAFDTGARYDPAADTWSATSSVNAPSPRALHSAVWTGDRMIVWGGGTLSPSETFATGGRYDPVGDTWTPTSTVGTPAPRAGATSVWTGTEMLIWGGMDLLFYPGWPLAGGGAYVSNP